MAKNSIRDYSNVNSSNTDIQSIDISEGCAASGINNAIREVMADLKDVSVGTVALESPSADSLTVTGDLTVDTDTLYVDSTNNQVGIGTSSPQEQLHIHGDASATRLRISGGGLNNTYGGFVEGEGVTGSGGRLRLGVVDNATDRVGIEILAQLNSIVFNTGSSTTERMRIDSSGNLLVGKTAAGENTAGTELNANGYALFVRDGNRVAQMNRLTSNGEILRFTKDGTNVGSIASHSGGGIILDGGGASNQTGFHFSNPATLPVFAGSLQDDRNDLGSNSYRFNDIYATNTTIQTSDANEKQQIAPLTDAEITAAKAISQLFKTFKWNSAIEAKGDAARTHTGVIAQQVETAMTDAGLDAGDYAFFISSTWWETQTDVPAVEAVAEVLDEDGNVVTEAVEAADAYTRTDTYETAEEAPEGAVERTRLGIRYPELLSFVGAATEQRLADIETRLTALENA